MKEIESTAKQLTLKLNNEIKNGKKRRHNKILQERQLVELELELRHDTSAQDFSERVTKSKFTRKRRRLRSRPKTMRA